MTFSYEPLTQADRDRMRALNVMISWARPNADRWTVDRATDDFLVRIMQDREPPHYYIFAFWWRDALHWVNLQGKTAPSTGYHLELVGFGAEPEVRPGIPQPGPIDQYAVGTALRSAVATYAVGDAASWFAGRRQTKGLPPLVDEAARIQMTVTPLDLTRSPHVVFRTDFPKELL